MVNEKNWNMEAQLLVFLFFKELVMSFSKKFELVNIDTYYGRGFIFPPHPCQNWFIFLCNVCTSFAGVRDLFVSLNLHFLNDK